MGLLTETDSIRKALYALGPAPSLATHIEIDGLAPDVDWVTHFEKRALQLQSSACTSAKQHIID